MLFEFYHMKKCHLKGLQTTAFPCNIKLYLMKSLDETGAPKPSLRA